MTLAPDTASSSRARTTRPACATVSRYIWSHGGEVLDGDKVIIDSPESVAALTTEQSMISGGVTPQAVASYTLGEADVAFLNGDSVFCRNWPYMYGLAGDPEMSKIKREQVDLSPLPVGEGQSAGCLGDGTCQSAPPRRCRTKLGSSFGS